MSVHKHLDATPGPYTAGFSHQGAGRVWKKGEMGETLIADCNIAGRGTASFYNTALLAASWDLYMALQALLDVVEEAAAEGRIEAGVEVMNAHDALEKARDSRE